MSSENNTTVYRSGYTMHLDIHNQMIEAMKITGEVNCSKYISRAVRAENKRIFNEDVNTFLNSCSISQLDLLKKEIKKRNL